MSPFKFLVWMFLVGSFHSLLHVDHVYHLPSVAQDDQKPGVLQLTRRNLQNLICWKTQNTKGKNLKVNGLIEHRVLCGNLDSGLLLLDKTPRLCEHHNLQVRIWVITNIKQHREAFILTYGLLLLHTLHLDVGELDEAEWESLGCGQVAQAKQNIPTILNNSACYGKHTKHAMYLWVTELSKMKITERPRVGYGRGG